MIKNFFDEIPENVPEEVIETIISSEHIRVERIISNDHSSPENFWYDQSENEFVLLLQGNAVIQFENYEQDLKQGDYLVIEAHKKHRVKSTSGSEKTIWLAIFY